MEKGRIGGKQRRRLGLSALLALSVAGMAGGAARAATVARAVDWTIDGTRYHSFLVYDDASAVRRPGLLMVPNWYGVNADAIAKAKMIAAGGEVVLLADVYGATLRPTDDAAAGRAARPLLADRALLTRRMAVAWNALKAQETAAPIDPARLAAIGFCFGGAAVLDLARSGADAKAVVAFHGELKTDDPSDARNIRASVLAISGADDSYTAPDFAGFMDEMRQSPAPWQFVVLGHAVHCFTERSAIPGSGACRYDARAAAEAYGLMRTWLAESFGEQRP